MHRLHRAEPLPSNLLDSKADEVGMVELVFRQSRQGVAADIEPQPLQRLGGVAVGNTVEGGQHDIDALEVWQKMCGYLYFPRLTKSTVMEEAIAAGASSREYFGLASGHGENGYLGFSFGKPTTPLMDALVLIDPAHASAYEASATPASVTSAQPQLDSEAIEQSEVGGSAIPGATPVPKPAGSALVRFFGTADLDPVRASLDFSTLMTELVELFVADPRAKVRIKIDIEAEHSDSFPESVVRAVRENARVLGVKSHFD